MDFIGDKYITHGQNLLEQPEVLWLYVTSDALIFVSYFIIFLTLVIVLKRSPNFSCQWVVCMFGFFVICNGLFHLSNILTIWFPNYWLDGLIRALTAAISIPTAVLFIPLAPKAIQYLIKTDKKLDETSAEVSIGKSPSKSEGFL